ncbi:hypothetical protein SAMN04487967_3561 [Natronorubrum sediminis]|uniref:Uncharacterized protein n=1 Tax=Natronorubrum sediminis TaxID=640943 RepID=A0A1H6G4M9_9EURY|nr:hypothetical protein SAMN04487967_3561 [Natronorubrum sediminis]
MNCVECVKCVNVPLLLSHDGRMIDVTLAVSTRSQSSDYRTMFTLCTQRRWYAGSRHRIWTTRSHPDRSWNRCTHSTPCRTCTLCTQLERRAKFEPFTRVGRSNSPNHLPLAGPQPTRGSSEPPTPLEPRRRCGPLKRCTQCRRLGQCGQCGLRTRSKPSRTCTQFRLHRSRQWRRRQRCSQQ